MKTKHCMSRVAIPFVLLACIVVSLKAYSETGYSNITSASICDLRNIGNGKARDGMIRENGQIANRLDSLKIPIYCPLIIDYDAYDYDVAMLAVNLSNRTQNFSCVLSEYDPFNFKIRSSRRARNIAPGFGDALLWEGWRLSDSLNRLDLRCEMPPGGTYGLIGVESLYR